jgi:hypothetical protein
MGGIEASTLSDLLFISTHDLNLDPTPTLHFALQYQRVDPVLVFIFFSITFPVYRYDFSW